MARYGVFVGVDRYENGIVNLNCSCSDAKALSGYFRKNGFEVTCLCDKDAHCGKIIETVRGIREKFRQGDLFVFYFAGHGVEYHNAHYLIGPTGYPGEHLLGIGSVTVSALLSESSSEGVNRLFILDCCRSNLIGARNLNYACPESRDLALEVCIEEDAQGLPPLIINSCSTGEQAFELDHHGVFTQAMLDILQAPQNPVTNFTSFQIQLNQRIRALIHAGQEQNISLMGNTVLWDTIPLFPNWGAQVPPPLPEGNNFSSATSVSALQEKTWDKTFKIAVLSILLAILGCVVYYVYDRSENFHNPAVLPPSPAVQPQTPVYITVAEKLYRHKAEQGNAEAQYQLGRCYHKGIKGVNKNYFEAVKWYQKAAKQEFAKAQTSLGYCYFNGQGVEKDVFKAVELFKKAAKQEFAKAQYNLGHCFFNGQGVEKDVYKAAELYQKAAKQEDAAAQNSLGYCYRYGIGVKKDVSKAVELFKKAAKQEFAAAQYKLGYCYEYGIGVKKDVSKAVELYQKAEKQEFAEAQYKLGNCYFNGQGVKKDVYKAVELYQKAEKQEFAKAQYKLGLCYEYGVGVKKDVYKAVELYQKAAKQEFAEAQYELGYCYGYGIGVKKDVSKAVELFKKAAKQEFAVAQTNLGICYEYGIGVNKNIDEAVKWYRKAAAQNHAQAVQRLKLLGRYGPDSTDEKRLRFHAAALLCFFQIR